MSTPYKSFGQINYEAIVKESGFAAPSWKSLSKRFKARYQAGAEAVRLSVITSIDVSSLPCAKNSK